jgi:eukaryotic-like serine/threonine-protein kinase
LIRTSGRRQQNGMTSVTKSVSLSRATALLQGTFMEIHPSRLMRGALAVCCALLLGTHSLPLVAQDVRGFELALVDLDGKKQVLGTLPPSVFAPRVSPDGKRVAFDLAEPSASGGQPAPRLYVAELDRLDQRRALSPVGKVRDMGPMWSHDGERLIFLATGESGDSVWWRRADGTGEAELLVDGRAPEGMTANGRQLAFITRTDKGDYGVSLLDIASKKITTLADQPGSDQHSSRISPNGRWIAYSSTETGRQEIWVEPLSQTGQRYRMTQNGGRHPMWSPDGSAIFFDQDGQMFRMEISLSASAAKASAPKGLPIRGFQQGPLRRQFDLMPDGKRFVMLFPVR